MPAATSGFHEPLVRCDVSELVNLPPFSADESGEFIALKGASASQVSFASSVRTKKMKEWYSDLSEAAYRALGGIADATWWLANQTRDSSNIGWPKSWTVTREEPTGTGLGQPSQSNSIREKLGAARQRLLGEEADATCLPGAVINTFEEFARKACRSPELSYLTMMALLYRQTKDPRILAKFAEARATIGKHLDAIDQILGNPGD